MSVEEPTEEDKANCQLIGKSISDIIRFSFDDEFRKSAFQLLGVSSSKDAENEIKERLIKMIQNQKEDSKKKGKNSKKTKVMQEQNDSSQEKEAADSSNASTDRDSQSNSPSNWLRVSSEQYKNAAKQNKLKFFSQPLFSPAYEKEFELAHSNGNSSNSQPLPHMSSFSLHNRAMSSSSEPSDDGISFCRKRFKESFKDNACKYLKRNSKSQFHRSFS